MSEVNDARRRAVEAAEEDLRRALPLALIYVGDAIRDADGTAVIGDALRTCAVELGALNVTLGERQ